ncbi:MAG: EF-hand domain-containing protein [Pseudomonadota bacterium]
MVSIPVFGGGEKPQSVFYSLDVNKDGKVVKEELLVLYPDKAIAETKLTIFDKNGDGYIVIEEFVEVYGKK